VVEAVQGLNIHQVEFALTLAVVGGGGGPEVVRHLETLPLSAPHGTVLLEKVAR
jgi:hypothetical protein